MRAVGGAAALAPDGSIDGQNDGKARRPWMDLPRCQSCHTGDASSHLTLADASLMATDGLRTLVAFQVGGRRRLAASGLEQRFAENANTLFRFSKGHGGVACEGCHNSTHAIWPNPVDLHNDNVAAKQLQGHAGTITECTTCHGAGTLALSLGGPHGMHVVADSRWTQGGHESWRSRTGRPALRATARLSAARRCHARQRNGTGVRAPWPRARRSAATTATTGRTAGTERTQASRRVGVGSRAF